MAHDQGSINGSDMPSALGLVVVIINDISLYQSMYLPQLYVKKSIIMEVMSLYIRSCK